MHAHCVVSCITLSEDDSEDVLREGERGEIWRVEERFNLQYRGERDGVEGEKRQRCLVDG